MRNREAAAGTDDGSTPRRAFATSGVADGSLRRRAAALCIVASLVGAVVLLASPAVVGAADDDDVVVRLSDDHVVTGAAADRTPSDPYVTTRDRGHRLVVDDGVVETEHGQAVTVDGNPVRVVDNNDPNLVVSHNNVLNDTLVVGESGAIETVEGNNTNVTVGDDGEDVWFEHANESDLDPTITTDESELNDNGEGQNLSVTVDVENRGYGEGDANVTMALVDGGGSTLDSIGENVTVTRGNSTELTFEYDIPTRPQFGDLRLDEAENVEVEIDGQDGHDAKPVTIHESQVLVDLVPPSSPPAEGDELEVTADINRTGNQPAGEQEFLVDFHVGHAKDDLEHVSTKSINLTGGAEGQLDFTYETQDGDSPSVYAQVSSGDAANTEQIDIYGGALRNRSVEANIVDRNVPDEGENLTITGEIGYAGVVPDGTHEYPIRMYVDGDVVEEKMVELEGDEWVHEEFTYRTQTGDAPRVEVDLKSPGSGDSARPRIYGSGFNVSITDVDTTVNETEFVVARATIENTGDVADEQTVRMRIDSAISDPDKVERHVIRRERVSLDVGEATSERFAYRTRERDVPEIEVAVISDNDEDTVNTTVRPQTPRFEVTNSSAVQDGDDLSLSATVNNTGIESGEQYVEYHLDGEVVHIERMALEPWEQRTLSQTVPAPGGGAYDFDVVTENHSATSVATVTDGDGGGGGSTSAEDPASEGPAETEPQPADGDGLPWRLIALGLAGLLLAAAVVRSYLADPENFPPSPSEVADGLRGTIAGVRVKAAVLIAAARAGEWGAIAAVAKSAVGLGAGTLIVQNELPRETVVRVRCQTAEDTVVLEDLELGPNEKRDLGSLPNVDQFKVGAGVEDITAHEEVFQNITGDVGVVLKAEGILIANLG